MVWAEMVLLLVAEISYRMIFFFFSTYQNCQIGSLSRLLSTSIFLQFSIHDLDKVGSKGRSICGSSFCVELLFGPANAKYRSSADIDIDDSD